MKNNDLTIEISTNNVLANSTLDIFFNKIFNITFIPLVRSDNIIFKYVVPFFISLIHFSSLFCLLFFPNYYYHQGEVLTMDLSIGFIIYIYLLYQQKNWNKVKCDEFVEIPKWKSNITFAFFVLFILYWLLYMVIQFILHNDNNISTQLLNILMSFSWYLYFSVVANIYYFICIKLTQRSESIRLFLKKLKENKYSVDEFYLNYDNHYKKIKNFSKNWNLLICLGFILLIFHIPNDLMLIIYNKSYIDISGFVIKSLALFWYIYSICNLNNYEKKIIAKLYKHKIFNINQIDEIHKYIEYKKLGLDLYGIKINGNFFIQFGLFVVNLVLPILYAFINKTF